MKEFSNGRRIMDTFFLLSNVFLDVFILHNYKNLKVNMSVVELRALLFILFLSVLKSVLEYNLFSLSLK